MSEANNNGNQSSDYVNFNQFIAQIADFGQFNNQQLYENSNLTAAATEFVPRNFVAPNSVPEVVPIPPSSLAAGDLPLSSLNLNGNVAAGTSATASATHKPNQRRSRGAIPKPAPKSHSNRNESFNRRKFNENGQEQNHSNDNRARSGYSKQQQVICNGSGSNSRNTKWSKGSVRCPADQHQYSSFNNNNAYSHSTRNGNNNDDRLPRRDNGHKRHPDFVPNRNLKQVPSSSALDPVDISQREKQIVEIDGGRLECLVCCDNIKPFQSTWNCKNCYHILHLKCVGKWGNSSKTDAGWRCPACQNVTEEVPNEYYCFCGKHKNPQYNRNDVAHSCGEVCHRLNGCPHPCTLLCHPGACPTCQASVVRQCGCGKTTKTVQCVQDDEILCDGVCEKVRDCGVHKCGAKCHTGICAACDETAEHQCHCGRNKKTVTCSRENQERTVFSCTKNCGRRLNCKNHKCQVTCHSGECRDCQLTPAVIRTCPCGKRLINGEERKSCLDPIPLCGDTCSKPLSCGPPSNPHRCMAKCHTGNCPPCLKATAVKCRCGHMDQQIKCKVLTTRADDARCKKKCPKKRSCGKHKCNLECCIDIDHVCPLPCPSQLSCGKHKCDRTCHPGHCSPCQRLSFQELACECGTQIIYPPVPCGTKRPACDKPCGRDHVCSHDVLHNCHTAPACPPCMMQTTQWCYGRHEQRKTIPCSQDSFTCGMPCNKELPCKRHQCKRACHAGPCFGSGELCKQSCPKPRLVCGHKCNAPCHDSDCPDTLCKETVEVVCECGNRKQNRLCNDFARDFRRIATAQLASSLQEMQSGMSSGLRDIFGPIKLSNNKTLDCNDDCKLLERNRRLAIGLQIRNPDLPSKLQAKYSEFLRGWAKKDLAFVTSIHDKLTELVKLSKDSKQRSRSHSFPVMNRDKRQVVHEMCEMFGVDAVAYDAEPQRNIVATAYKDRSWLPGMSIMEVLRRETGQRRIHVPSNLRRP